MNPKDLANVILFLIYLYGFGSLATRFLTKMNLENTVIRLGVGLAAFPVFALFLNVLHIPIDWKIFFILSLGVIVIDIIKNRKSIRLSQRLQKPRLPIVILLFLFVVSLLIYCCGSFQYPWLEDDDSWGHAASIKYITVEKDLNPPDGTFQYLNPYPPGYDTVFAILHQTHPSLNWTLKFFNGFIIALGVLFFFYFAREFTKNDRKALWATFFFVAIPCYLSHFIWAHSLVVTLFFPAFYTILKSEENKRYILPAVIITTAIFITQPTQSIKFVILIILLSIAYLLIKRKINTRIISVLLCSFLISLLWWGPVIGKYMTQSLIIPLRGETVTYDSADPHDSNPLMDFMEPSGGTATRSYSLSDYLIGSEINMINNPIGVGAPLCFLAYFGIFYIFYYFKRGDADHKVYALTTIFWLIFTFLGMNSKTFNLPIGLFAFRFWMLFAIPVCFLAAETVLQLLHAQLKTKIKYLRAIVVILLVFLTSGFYKISVNMAPWPWGVEWTTMREINGYHWLRNNLPPNTKVFTFADNKFVIGFDMQADFWSEQYRSSLENALEFNNQQLSDRLRENKFEYLIIGGREVKKFGWQVILDKANSFNDSENFQLIYHLNPDLWVFKVI